MIAVLVVFDVLVLIVRAGIAVLLGLLLVVALPVLAFSPAQLHVLFAGWCRLIGVHVFKTTIHQRSSKPDDELATRPFNEDHVYTELVAERDEFEKLRATAKEAGVYVGPARVRWFEPFGTTRKYIYYLRVSNWREKNAR